MFFNSKKNFALDSRPPVTIFQVQPCEKKNYMERETGGGGGGGGDGEAFHKIGLSPNVPIWETLHKLYLA